MDIDDQTVYKALWTIIRLFFGFVVLVSAWCGFLFLVDGGLPVDTTSALIMVWISVLLLLVLAFPQVLGSIKKLKIKDFELELREAVTESRIEKTVAITDLDEEYPLSRKSDWRNLHRTLIQASRNPDTPMLLVVNVKNGGSISIPKLFVYLASMNIVSESVIVIFVSTSRQIEHVSNISRDSIIGVISGNKAVQTMAYRYQYLSRAFRVVERAISFIIETDFEPESSEFSERIQGMFNDMFSNHIGRRLSEGDIRILFQGRLNHRFVSSKLDTFDVKNIEDAIASEDDFVLLVDNDAVTSVVSLCSLSRKLSRQALRTWSQSART